VAAVLTPTPDAVNQLLMAGPMVILYEVGIWVSWFVDKSRKEEKAAKEAAKAAEKAAAAAPPKGGASQENAAPQPEAAAAQPAATEKDSKDA
jgi:sec-independent protein translocase protein TatC